MPSGCWVFQRRIGCERTTLSDPQDKGTTMSKKTGEFEFKLSRSGLTFFTFVIAVVLLLSFVGGVIVGKNIETYPEKIAKGIPNVIKETIVKRIDIKPEMDTEDRAEAQVKPPDTEEQEEKVEFTFYDRLKKTDEEVTETLTTEEPLSPDTSPFAPPPKKEVGLYTIQVASFRDKGMTRALCDKLSDMGHEPRVDEVDLKSGKWFRIQLEGFNTYDEAKRIASRVGEKVKGIKCLIRKNRKSG